MSVNDSSTGGPLAPVAGQTLQNGVLMYGGLLAPPEDNDLDAVLQSLIVGLTGLAGTLVLPRWQPVSPKQPEATVNWCAIGVIGITPDANAIMLHQSSGVGSDQMQRHEQIDALASFYGPAAYTYAAMLRDGLYVGQNREPLFFQNMDLIETGRIISAPELVNETWVKRADIQVSFRREVIRTYPIENVLSAAGTIIGNLNTPWAANGP